MFFEIANINVTNALKKIPKKVGNHCYILNKAYILLGMFTDQI